MEGVRTLPFSAAATATVDRVRAVTHRNTAWTSPWTGRLAVRSSAATCLALTPADASHDGLMHWLLTYDYVDDIATRRAPFREAHLALVRDLHDRGELLMAGAVGEPIEGALFVFTAPDQALVEEFVAQDPYVREGLVTASQVRPWNVVVGQVLAATLSAHGAAPLFGHLSAGLDGDHGLR